MAEREARFPAHLSMAARPVPGPVRQGFAEPLPWCLRGGRPVIRCGGQAAHFGDCVAPGSTYNTPPVCIAAIELSMHVINGEQDAQSVCNSAEAMEAYRRWSHLLTDAQRGKLLAASLSRDGGGWCILSGSDLTF